jgi:peptide/nickel transport system substrate-binding protein
MTTSHHSGSSSGLSRRAFLTRAATFAGGAALSLALLPACAPAAPSPAAKQPAAPAAPATAAPAAKAPEKPAEKPAAQAPAAAPAAKPAADAKPRSGGKLTAVTEANWVDLEPHKNALFASTQAYDHIYEALTEYDQNLKAAPALAESWETPDPQTQIFKLRQGVTWHDGSPLTAEDVKYSIERVRAADTASPWRDSYGSVDTVEVVDPRTVKLTHTRPNAFFLETLASLRGTAIIQNGSAEKLDLKREAVGTGPFKLAEIKNGDFVRFERNAAYWGKPRPYVDELTLKLMV